MEPPAVWVPDAEHAAESDCVFADSDGDAFCGGDCACGGARECEGECGGLMVREVRDDDSKGGAKGGIVLEGG